MKTLLMLAGSLAFAFAVTPTVARACDGEEHAAKGAAQGAHAARAAGDKVKVEKVSLEGKVVTFGCPMEAARKECTGAALVVGETKHPIKRAEKGGELVEKAKDQGKLVKVSGTKSGDYLTVASYTIKS